MFEDLVTSFQLETSAVRGRPVRIRPVLEDILTRHQYPPLINKQLSEMIALAVALASLFKAEGIFTLQIQGAGPIHLMVVDVTATREIRACARFNEEKLPPFSGTLPSIQQLFGSGSLVFALEQGEDTHRYQGIVELTAKTLVECIYHFFRQSDQISTGIVVFSQEIIPQSSQKGCLAGALLIQRLAVQSQEVSVPGQSAVYEEDSWFHLLSLLGTVKPHELLELGGDSLEILYNLFWEEGVRVFESHSLKANCRCSKERVLEMICHFPEEERKAMLVENRVEITCEFCNACYHLSEEEIFQEPLKN